GVNGCPKKEEADVSTTGLSMSFVENAPPVSTAVNKEFAIYVDVTNKGGEYIIKDKARFYLRGIGQNLENVHSALSNDDTLAKESVFSNRLVFSEKAKFTFPLQNIFVLPLILTSCYDYGGVSQATICISASNESRVCSISGEKITSNTAGPIQITSLTESLVGNKLQLIFTITNKGSGQVYLFDTDCDKLEANDFSESQKQGKLNVEVRAKDNFKCRFQSERPPYGQILGASGVIPLGKVLCEKEISNEEYSSPFTIVMRYKYRDSINHNINILPA
ncbi:unnamed protein product, partial [marine sediment metagenome]